MKKKLWVSFDFWETLFKANPQYKPARNQFIVDILFPFLLGSDTNYADAVIKNTKNLCDYTNEVTGGQLTWKQSILIIASEFMGASELFSDKIGMQKKLEQYDEAHKMLVEKFPPLIYSPDTADVLFELKKAGVGMNIACNTSFIPGDYLRAAVLNSGYEQYFDFQLYSDDIGVSKPNPSFFETIKGQIYIKDKTIEPHHILHVGDNPFADGGSVAADIDFLQINSNGHSILDVLNHI